MLIQQLRALVYRMRRPSSDERVTVPDDGSLSATFSRVYHSQQWGLPKPWQRGDARFFSGPGSHNSSIVKPYVTAVREFFKMRPGLDAVDLGCGDFNIGRQVRTRFRNYIACDIVSELTERNRRVFAAANVDFRCLNIVDDELPQGQVVFIRQVLQHLSNEQIAQVIAKLKGFDFLVLTEHLPSTTDFVPNLDHVAGSGLRLASNSGVVLTEPPFRLQFRSHWRLCEVSQFGGIIRTDAYEL